MSSFYIDSLLVFDEKAQHIVGKKDDFLTFTACQLGLCILPKGLLVRHNNNFTTLCFEIDFHTDVLHSHNNALCIWLIFNVKYAMSACKQSRLGMGGVQGIDRQSLLAVAFVFLV